MSTAMIETISAKVHERWVMGKLAEGINSYCRRQTGEEMMVPYEQLSEDVKDLNRDWVWEVLLALDELFPSRTPFKVACRDFLIKFTVVLLLAEGLAFVVQLAMPAYSEIPKSLPHFIADQWSWIASHLHYLWSDK